MRIVRSLAAVAAAFGVALAAPAGAQQFPNKPITIVVPTAPGGPLDVLTRMFEPKASPLLGQPIVVENRPGAGTYVGGEAVARAAPDGTTLLMNATGGLFPDVFQKGLAVKLSDNLVPVALLGTATYFMYGPASVQANDLRELVNLLKANPNKYNLAIFPGALLTLQMLNFLKSQNVEMLQVPFNSAANITTAMLRGDVHLYIGSISAIRAQIDAGKLKVFTTIGDKRSPAAPTTPTSKESGFSVDLAGDYALFAPAKTPPPVLETINARFRQAAENPEIKAGLTKLGFELVPESLPAMAKKFDQLKVDVPKMARDANVVPQ